MTPAEYLAALHAAGIPPTIGLMELDDATAVLLRIDRRTARRYRRGEIPIPGPVVVALECLGRDGGTCTR